MSIATYGELKTALASWSKRADLTDQLPDFITYAHSEINRTLRANVMLATADLTINAETISQPTGFLAFRRLYLDLSPRQQIETVSPEGAMDLSARYSSSTYPSHVAKEGTLLRFAPLFTGTVTGKALYYKSLTAMSAASDYNAVLTAYPFLYLYGALAELFRYIEDDNLADRYESTFRAMITDINASEARDVMSGPLQAAPYPGGIV